MAIVLSSLLAGCSFPFQKGSPKTEDALKVSPTEGKRNAAGESRIFPPDDEPAPFLSDLPLKKEENQPPSPDSLLRAALESFQRSQDFRQSGDWGGATAALDQAYQLILQVNPNGDQELSQRKEKIRVLICKRMLEIHATRHSTTKGSGEAIPLALNAYVQRELNLFRGVERKFFIEAHKRSGRYRPMIVAALEKAGLPKELSWVPLIESGYRADAFSPARALGLWQFIPSTGHKFGLKRDQWVDERMDAVKSTDAAIAYLKELHHIFGDWCTVLAAYNCGEARVLEVIRAQRINYLDNFWDLFEKLPLETARYVPRFIAALLIINNPGKFGLDLEEPYAPISYETVSISQRVLLKDIARTLAVSGENLEVLNPELRMKMTPPGPYEFKVPDGKGHLLLSKLNELPVSKSSLKGSTFHQVERGDTLIQLAGRYRTSVHAIAEVNQIKEKDLLRVGQKLKIPMEGPEIGEEKKERAVEVSAAAILHPLRYRVKRGDTLQNIAQRYQTKVREIMTLNHLQNAHLRIDQELLISPGKNYVVAGDPFPRLPLMK